MLGNRFRLFRLFGIPISLDFSWLIILALLTWTMAEVFRSPFYPLSEFYPPGGLGLSEGGYLLMGLLAALTFFLCIVLHEFGHALVARANGMPIRGITLFLFGGVAELEGEPPSAGSEFLMAIAGPLVSLFLGLGFGLLANLGHNGGWPPAVVVGCAYLSSINIMVLIFNLIPAFPLDGGRVLRSILWGITGRLRRATYWASLCGQGFAWFLIVVGVANFFGGNLIGGLWFGLIGLFLNTAARSSYQQVVIKQLLEGEPVRRFMNPRPILVPPTLDLHTWVEEYVYRYHRKTFPVGTEGHLDGYVTTRALARYPRGEWMQHTVGEVMERDLRAVSIAPETDALHALTIMQRTGASRLLVVADGKLVGIVSLKDLLGFLQLKLELNESEDEHPTPPAPGAHDIPGWPHEPAHS
jgi:Zn-dependent protease